MTPTPHQKHVMLYNYYTGKMWQAVTRKNLHYKNKMTFIQDQRRYILGCLYANDARQLARAVLDFLYVRNKNESIQKT